MITMRHCIIMELMKMHIEHLIKKDNSLAELIHPSLPYIKAEIDLGCTK